MQSIWLLLASACAFLTLKLPTYSGTTPDGIPSSELMGMPNFLLTVVTVVIAVLCLISIFMYSNRKLQFRLCLLALVLEIILIILYYTEIKKYMEGTFSLTAIFHVGVILFLFLAARGINNDDNIIKESDRLR
jgi:predicted membrane channel-forming protein YqfA (hemolysin III family)